MDIKIQEITIPTFLWYVVPGINFIAFDITFPIIAANSKLINGFDTVGAVLAIFIISIIIGFIMDSAKLYQYTFGYKKRHKEFFEKAAQMASIEVKELMIFFESIRVGSPTKGSFGKALAFEHSRWVMINHTSKCFFLLGIIWIVLMITSIVDSQNLAYLKQIGIENDLWGFILNLVLFSTIVWLGFRLRKISISLQKSAGEKYLKLIQKYRDDIVNFNF